jgi:16S rRNA (cytidine1402-2'-O)-methyltransferase
MSGTLYIVSTPIGNLEDITLRALKVMASADLIAAEDTRHTMRLLKANGIDTPLVSYHEHNEEKRSAELVERLIAGQSMALTTNAGTPLVSDPGYRLVCAALENDIPVVPIPGACAAITALSASGLPTDRFTFAGFPARKKAKRLQQLRQLADAPQSLIFYQSPKRIIGFLEELMDVLGDRHAVLARELTKIHEEFLRGPLSEITAVLKQRDTVKGECTLMISGAKEETRSPEELEAAIAHALAHEEGSLSMIARTLALHFGLPRKMIYEKALQMQSDQRRTKG